MEQASAWVDIDWAAFDPWRIQPARHRLVDHPLLQIEQLVELGKRLEADRQLFTFNSDATASNNFDEVSKLHPNRKSVAETLQGISDANAWMLLRHVQTDATYRTLVDEVLDGLKSHVDHQDPGMYYRAGWIFVTSPHTTTPFHMDHDHVLLLQMRGCKRVHVWDHDDAVVVSDHARDRFHSRRLPQLMQWHEEYRERAHVFDLKPGTGVYMPMGSPHMVETHDDASVTLSLSYDTDATQRNARLHVAHDLMRRIGIDPPPVNRRASFDASIHAGILALTGVRDCARRMAGRTVTRPVHASP